jgi:hypothetical protein
MDFAIASRDLKNPPRSVMAHRRGLLSMTWLMASRDRAAHVLLRDALCHGPGSVGTH